MSDTCRYGQSGEAAGFGDQPEAEADEHDAGDPLDPPLHRGPPQPADAAVGQPGDNGEPQAGLGDEPDPKDERELRRRDAGWDERGRNAMKNTLILGLNRLDSRPLR